MLSPKLISKNLFVAASSGKGTSFAERHVTLKSEVQIT